MATTTFLEGSGTRTWGGHQAVRCSDDLLARYQALLDEKRLSWTEHHRLVRLLGSGGQGVVYLSQRRGTDKFTLPVALKIFSPERYEDDRVYDDAMGRMAEVAAHVAQIQQDNLLDVHNWVDRIADPHDGNGMGQRLRPQPPADPRDARPHAAPRQYRSAGSTSTR